MRHQRVMHLGIACAGIGLIVGCAAPSGSLGSSTESPIPAAVPSAEAPTGEPTTANKVTTVDTSCVNRDIAWWLVGYRKDARYSLAELTVSSLGSLFDVSRPVDAGITEREIYTRAAVVIQRTVFGPPVKADEIAVLGGTIGGATYTTANGVPGMTPGSRTFAVLRHDRDAGWLLVNSYLREGDRVILNGGCQTPAAGQHATPFTDTIPVLKGGVAGAERSPHAVSIPVQEFLAPVGG